MNPTNRIIILIFIINLISNIAFARHSNKFTIVIETITEIDTNYQGLIEQLAIDCFLSTGNFIMEGSAQNFSVKNSKLTMNSKLKLILKVQKAKMEKIKAASYNYNSQETNFTDCYNFVILLELTLIDLNTGLNIYSKMFDIDHKGPFEPGILAISEYKAIRRSGNLLMASILSWLNSEMASFGQISDRIQLVNSQHVTLSDVASR